MLARSKPLRTSWSPMPVTQTGNRYAEMARKSSQRGTRYFIFFQWHDDKMPHPSHRGRGTDNPFKEWRATVYFRWYIQDIRTFGFWGWWRKMFYLQLAWFKKGEKIFCGKDELGNTYWQCWDAGSMACMRFMEPPDPHWFRANGTDNIHPAWMQWMARNMAHTPAQVKARGEFGYHARITGGYSTFNMKWRPEFAGYAALGNDPTYVPSTSMILSPWYKLLKEAGFCKYNFNRIPTHEPLREPHDLKQEVVEDFYRGWCGCFGKWSRGVDHDESRGN